MRLARGQSGVSPGCFVSIWRVGREARTNDMSEGKTSISNASSYAEIGEFWDTHGLSEYWDQTKPAEFEVDLRSSVQERVTEEPPSK